MKAAHSTILNAIFLFLLIFFIPATRAADVVAKVSFVRGSVAAISGDKSRILGKDDSLYRGDNIQTSTQSFVILLFDDGAKITVRPDSSFSIDEYSGKQATMELHKGGIRASTGEIAKNEPGSFQIKTPQTTVNAQQADYSVRLCEQDCQEDADRVKDKKMESSKPVVARVAKVQGKVVAQEKKKDAKPRALVMGSPLYSGDHLKSEKSSYVVLAFSDGGRITVHENTEYEISDYKYKQADGKDKAIHKLFVGGLRVLTGHVGKVKKEDFKVNTPVATIGIRGTGFDLQCVGDCINAGGKPYRNAKGLYAKVWQGEIGQKNAAGESVLTAPENSYIANQHSRSIKLPDLPANIMKSMPPRPDQVPVNQAHLFGRTTLNGTPPGLYVTVHEGYVRLGTSELDLGRDESGYVGQDGEMIRLELQMFQEQDAYPLPSEFDESKADIRGYSLLVDDYKVEGGQVFECSAE